MESSLFLLQNPFGAVMRQKTVHFGSFCLRNPQTENTTGANWQLQQVVSALAVMFAERVNHSSSQTHRRSWKRRVEKGDALESWKIEFWGCLQLYAGCKDHQPKVYVLFSAADSQFIINIRGYYSMWWFFRDDRDVFPLSLVQRKKRHGEYNYNCLKG